MSRRSIFYVLGVVALSATAADLARHGYVSGSKAVGLKKDRGAAAESARSSLGRAATTADFAKHEYLVGPKGTGLPKGRGAATEGRVIYMQSCAACHGLRGEGSNDYPPLVGVRIRSRATSHCQLSGVTGHMRQRCGIT
jgi:mono/diheme cytochrome c family protein